MSCYIVEDKHIYYLACVAFGRSLKYEWGGQTNCIDRVDKAVRIAEEMLRENHASLFARYREVCHMGAVDPNLIRKINVRDGDTTFAQIVMSIDCLCYQSCEHDGWENSQAYAFLNALRDNIISNPKVETYKDSSSATLYPVGWDDAHWGCCPRFELKPKPKHSPMMQQWHELRGKLDPDVVLAFQLGDFYELFNFDAERCAERLEITLTHRHGIPMAGIPCHVKDKYFTKLLNDGLSVAIVEQVERSTLVKIGKRKLTKILKPDTSSAEAFARSNQKENPKLPRSQRIASAKQGLVWLKPFMGTAQISAVADALRGEEWECFCDLIEGLVQQFMFAPHTYDQRQEIDREKDMTVHFHYFKGGMDWYIMELDRGLHQSDPDYDPNDRRQLQAWGYVNLGDDQCAETGYISLDEITKLGAELDFHFDPRPLAECKPTHHKHQKAL